MISSEKIDHTVHLLKELRDICIQHKELHFISGINAALFELQNRNSENESSWKNAASIYKTFAGVKNGLSDFYLDAPTVSERIKINERLDEIKKNLWILLEGQT